MPQSKQVARSRQRAAPSSGKSRLPRAGASLLTAAALGALFAAYSAATRSLRAQPPKPLTHHRTEQPASTKNEELAERLARQYLAEQPWTATAKNRANTVDKTSFWYWQEWKQESEKVISLKPFAMVSKRKDAKPGDRPYSVSADKAFITFASKVSLLGGSPGAIVGAELEGAVQIQGPNNLRIDGRNFYFQKGDPNVVYSDDRLRFRADRHFGTAKGLQLELLRNETAKPDEPISIGGISSVKLLQDVDMTLVADSFEQSMARPAGGPPAAPRAKGPETPPQPVRCQSVGSFTFVLATHEATFERNVRIRRQTAPDKFDFIAADDSVKIVFDVKKPAPPAPPAPGQAKGAPAAAKSGTFDPNLSFKELHAHGKDVSLVSEANGLRAIKLHDLDYDRTARRAKLSAAPARAQIWHREDLLRAPIIQIDHDEAGQEITEVWCRGEGDMRHVDEKTHEVDLAADWKKEMHKHADPKSGFDVVDLEEAMIEQAKEGSGIAADHISLYLVPQKAGDQRVSRPNMPPAAPSAQKGPQIHHMLAWQQTEKVAMVSRQLEAESKRLEIWFEDGPASAPRAGGDRVPLRPEPSPGDKPVVGAINGENAAPIESRGTERMPARRRIEPASASEAQRIPNSEPRVGEAENRTVVNKPAASPPAGGLLGPGGGQGEPYVMKADEIFVRVIRESPGVPAQVSNVLSKGSVHLTQAQKGATEPLVIDGDTLEVENRGPLDQEMIVHGQPAHVRNRGAHIEGNRIVFNRATNTADVDGAGQLQLPMKSAADRDKPQRTTPFDVSWLNKMHFDGNTALFTGTVRSKMDDGEEKTEVRCSQMGVTLTKPFSFSQEHKDQEQPEIQSVDCYGGVEFDSDSTLDDKLVEMRRGVFAQFHFDKPSGKSQAHGPGLLRVWRHNENGQSGFSQFANVQSNSPPKNRKSTAWEYIQVKFTGPMDGNFSEMLTPPPDARKASHKPQASAPASRSARGRGPGSSILGANGSWTAVFHDHVEVIYGPVDQPRETVGRDCLIDQSGWLGCETLRVDQHPQTAVKDQFLTLLATGNSQIEGKDFRGEGETISYDGSKTLYVLRGDASRPARLWRQPKVGGDLSRSVSNQIQFNTQEGTVKQDQTKTLDWSP